MGWALLGLGTVALWSGCNNRPASQGGDLTGRTCTDVSRCGPEPGVASQVCPDGTTTGPACLEHQDGSCTWEFSSCSDGGATDGGGVHQVNCSPLDEATCKTTRGCAPAYVMSGCVCSSSDPNCTCPPPPPPQFTGCNQVTCFYFGQSYNVDETFTSADGCDTCTCGQDGQATCTDTGCAPLKWFATCGPPVCGGPSPQPDPSVRTCTAEETVGATCASANDTCAPANAGCSGNLVCSTTDPTNGGECPVSRAEYKQDIRYLDRATQERLASEVMSMRLATYRYKPGVADGGQGQHLGFIIDDLGEGAACVQPDGQHVDLYGYTSMAVAALQVQARQIEELKSEIAALKASLQPASPARSKSAPRR
jgi:hypothetical protein